MLYVWGRSIYHWCCQFVFDDVEVLCSHKWKKTRSNQTYFLIPLTGERLHIMSYTNSYYMDGGCHKENDSCWLDLIICQVLLLLYFNEHGSTHQPSCFKMGCECRFFFAFSTCGIIEMYEDRGYKDENVESWHQLNGANRK